MLIEWAGQTEKFFLSCSKLSPRCSFCSVVNTMFRSAFSVQLETMQAVCAACFLSHRGLYLSSPVCRLILSPQVLQMQASSATVPLVYLFNQSRCCTDHFTGWVYWECGWLQRQHFLHCPLWMFFICVAMFWKTTRYVSIIPVCAGVHDLWSILPLVYRPFEYIT